MCGARAPLIAILVSFTMTAWADTLQLQNGDRISGIVSGVDEEHIVIETEYAGPLHIPAGQVRVLTVDTALEDRVGDATDRLRDLAGANEFSIQEPGETEESSEEKAPVAEEAPRKWSGSVETGVNFRSGETDTFDATLSLSATRTWPRDRLILNASWAYGESEEETDARRVSGSAKVEHDLSERLYVFGMTGAEYDPFKHLDLRIEAAGGVGYTAIENEKRKLVLEGGLSYAWERWRKYTPTELADAKEDAKGARLVSTQSALSYLRSLRGKPAGSVTFLDLATGAQRIFAPFDIEARQEITEEHRISLRLAANYRQQLFKRAVLTESLVVLPHLDDFGEGRLTSDLALETPLSERMSLRLNLKSSYDSDTGDGDDEWTNDFILSLRYNF